jgi:hypothetical protein
MVSLARAYPGPSLLLRTLKIAIFEFKKIVKELKSFLLFSLTAILKALRIRNSSTSKISLEEPNVKHFSFYFAVF